MHPQTVFLNRQPYPPSHDVFASLCHIVLYHIMHIMWYRAFHVLDVSLDFTQERKLMRNPYFHLTKFFACAVILLLTCCVYMHQAQGLCSTLTIMLEPQGRYKHCLMQIDVRGNGTLFDGKTHHRNSSERYVLYQGRRKAFRLYTEHTQSSLQIRLNDRDITDTIQNGTIVIKDARKQQHLVLYFQETK